MTISPWWNFWHFSAVAAFCHFAKIQLISMNNKLSREMCIFRHISKSRNRKALKFAELTIRSTKQHTQKIVLLSCKGAGGLLKIEKKLHNLKNWADLWALGEIFQG